MLTAPAAPRMLNRQKLLATIHATAKQLNLTDDLRYDLQLSLTGVTSCKDMTLAQLKKVQTRLLAMANPSQDGGRPARPGRDERRPMEPPTRQQLDLIHNLTDVIGLTLDQYRDVCLRIVKHSWPQTRAEANQVIEGLKAMEKRGWHPTHEAAR